MITPTFQYSKYEYRLCFLSYICIFSLITDRFCQKSFWYRNIIFLNKYCTVMGKIMTFLFLNQGQGHSDQFLIGLVCRTLKMHVIASKFGRNVTFIKHNSDLIWRTNFRFFMWYFVSQFGCEVYEGHRNSIWFQYNSYKLPLHVYSYMINAVGYML